MSAFAAALMADSYALGAIMRDRTDQTFAEMHDDHVRLRPLRGEDAPALFEAIRESIDMLVPWMPWCHSSYSLEEAQAWIRSSHDAWQSRSEFSFAVLAVGSDRMLGVCGLNWIEWPALRANLGYWVRTSEAGRGVATRAARLLAQFAFAQLGMERIEIVAAIDNQASQQVAIKLGAQREGLARRRVRIRQIQHDALVFSLVRQDWPLAPRTPADEESP